MPKQKPAPPLISGTLAELEEQRYAASVKRGDAIAAYRDTQPLSLQRRAAAKKLAASEEALYNITRALEDKDPDWRAANLAEALRKLVTVWYPLNDMAVPEWAKPRVEVLQAASLWAA